MDLSSGILCHGSCVVSDPSASVWDQLTVSKLDGRDLNLEIDMAANVTQLRAGDHVTRWGL